MRPRRRSMRLLRFALAGTLGVLTALLVSCGGSGKGLIPAANAGPLKADFEAVAAAAQSGNGSCGATIAALAKTVHDFNELPSSVDSGLHKTLREGIENLRRQALKQCAQASSTTTTATTQKTATTTTTATNTTTTSTTPTTPTETTTTPTTTTTTTSTGGGSGGGTPAPPGEGENNGGGAAAGGQEAGH